MKHFLDITKDHCPMTFVKVKLKLEKIDEGDQLEVLLTEGEPLRNVPKSAAEQGHKIINIESREDGNYQVVIEK
ncbi:sulfurtransferase TusA family protein [Candidatus Poribacteria bacterium]